jgi:uncharacterized membrane protein YhaH (DUF805 family)
MRGEILQFDEASGSGLISGDDGERYSLSFRDLISPTRLFTGQSVDFLPRDGIATEVVVRQTAHAAFARSSGVESEGPAEFSPWGYFMKSMRMYVDGNGRARRSEYWWFIFFQSLILLPPVFLGFFFFVLGGDSYDDGLEIIGSLFLVLAGIVWLGFILPSICVTVRRFHDVGLSGWLVLLGVIPYVGGLITFIITLLPSQADRNVYGPNPKNHVDDVANNPA